MPKAPNTRARLDRDAGILRDRARGISWAVIADRYNVSIRVAQRIWKASLDRSWAEEPADATDVLAELIAQLEATTEDFSLLAETTKNDAVKLGALRMRHHTLATKITLLRLTGVLPRELEWLDGELDLVSAREAMVDVLRRNRVPREVLQELHDAVQPGLRQRVATMKVAQARVEKNADGRARAGVNVSA